MPLPLRELLNDRRIHWQGFFGSYAVGLDRLFPIASVSCLDHGAEFESVAATTGIRFVAAEEPGTRRRNWIGSGIDAVLERREHEIEMLLAAGDAGTWRVVSSPPSARLESLCRRHGIRYAGPPAASTALFAHKRVLFQALEILGLPHAAGRWVRLGEARYSELANELGARFVAQAGLGGAGSNTLLVGSASDLARAAARFAGEEVHVAPHLGSRSLNVNAAVIGGVVCVGPPNVQLAGVARLGAPWGGYCGNDYGAARSLEPSITGDVREQTARIGEWLARRDFEGLFGLDFVIGDEDGRARAVDLNPRWQGSTALSTQAEHAAGRLPLAAAELAWRCGAIDLDTIRAGRDQFARPLDGAHMCLRHPGRVPHVVPARIEPGVYRCGRPELVRSAFRLDDCEDDGEWLLTGGVPLPGTVIEPGAWLVRAMTRSPLAGRDSADLVPWADETAAAIYEMFGLSGARAERYEPASAG